MKNQIPKIMAINDLSSYGRVALSVVIPIISCMGTQVVPLPTVLLSSNAAYENFTFCKLTQNMKDILAHWKSINISFDAIYSGFIGDIEQIEIVKSAIDTFKKEDQLVVVDPVMGDNGKLYATFDMNFVGAMRELVAKSTLITPNITEASLLLKNEIDFSDMSQENMKRWAKELSDLGPQIVILTSIPDEMVKTNTCVIAYEKKWNKFWKVSCSFIPANYPML